jgi:hypothetical protein
VSTYPLVPTALVLIGKEPVSDGKVQLTEKRKRSPESELLENFEIAKLVSKK